MNARRRVTYVRRFPDDKLIFKLLVGVMTLMVVLETVSLAVGAQRRTPNLTRRSFAGYQRFLDLELGLRELCQSCWSWYHPLADEAAPFAVGTSFISGFGDPPAEPNSASQGSVAFVVQMFYTWRIWRIGSGFGGRFGKLSFVLIPPLLPVIAELPC